MTGADQSATVLDRVVRHLRRFVVFPSSAEWDFLALWVVHTHAIDAAHATPYPNVHSPLPRCGKTTLFEVLSQLVRYPQTASNISPAALFRVLEAEHPTMLLDEIDSQFKDDPEKSSAIRSIVNAGYRRGPGASVVRCVGPNHRVEHFDVFGPKAFAGIQANEVGVLHATTLDRLAPIRLERKTAGDQTERFRARLVAQQADALREAPRGWRRTWRRWARRCRSCPRSSTTAPKRSASR